MAKILLVGWRNRAGLARDLAILADVLAPAGHAIDVQGSTPPRRLARLWRRLRAGGPPYDLALFVERAVPQWMTLARRNALLPNPEWHEAAPFHAGLDAILCKTRSAEALFAAGHPRACYVGFTSLEPAVEAGPAADRPWGALHIAGRSPNKGTAGLIQAWGRHPEWPTLTLVAWREYLPLPTSLPGNVTVIDQYVDDLTLARLQRAHRIHLCPSEAEGYGHTIAEALACGAVVVTTDAPPMNELVGPERGLLVPWRESEPVRFGTRYLPDPDALEAAIGDVLAWDQARLDEVGRAGRRWFEDQDRAFRARLPRVIEALVAGRPVEG